MALVCIAPERSFLSQHTFSEEFAVMSRVRLRKAFTLIEVLIVVIIMAVLAATIIPQFSSSTDDAKESSLRFNLHTIRSQIEMYRIHHLNTAPAFATFASQMTHATNVDGAITGSNLIYGPYIQGELPNNPFTGTNTLVAVASPGTEPTGIVGAAEGASAAGWQYDATTGGFYPNNAEYYKTK